MMEQEARTKLDAAVAEEIRRRVLEEPGCLRLTLTLRRGGGASRESLRPILLHGDTVWQTTRVVSGRTTVRNHAAAETPAVLLAMLEETGPREYHLLTAAGDLHVRITRKGRALVARSRPSGLAVAPRPHDRVKEQPLAAFDAGALLRVLGMSDGEGQLRANMRGKAAQINAFLREVDAVLPPPAEAGEGAAAPLEIVDCGSGGAYLTLAAYCYLTQARGRRARVHGIDRNAALVAKANRMAADLDAAADVVFVAADLATCRLETKPDLLLSLHACDTATDQALARGVEWGAATMLVAPCCQHELRPAGAQDGPLRALLRHGILRERLADLLTDACRAQLLRILGYRVRIVEFVGPEASARNLLLRAVAGLRPGQGKTVEEYRALRAFCQLPPVLETILALRLKPWLRDMTPVALVP